MTGDCLDEARSMHINAAERCAIAIAEQVE